MGSGIAKAAVYLNVESGLLVNAAELRLAVQYQIAIVVIRKVRVKLHSLNTLRSRGTDFGQVGSPLPELIPRSKFYPFKF